LSQVRQKAKLKNGPVTLTADALAPRSRRRPAKRRIVGKERGNSRIGNNAQKKRTGGEPPPSVRRKEYLVVLQQSYDVGPDQYKSFFVESGHPLLGSRGALSGSNQDINPDRDSPSGTK
jgi:hypothetical protein